MGNKTSIRLVIFGLLLLAGAFALTMYNMMIQKASGVASQRILEQLTEGLPKEEPTDHSQTDFTKLMFPEYILYTPDYVLNPNMDMPEKTVDGKNYIAMLSIPSLVIELPVNSEWNYTNLKSTPCRYSGSAYTDDLVICAHNFNSHFAGIKYLNVGNSVILTDMDGNTFRYSVVETEILDPYAIEEMEKGNWDLTLFTCTVGGLNRVAVRCELV